MVTLTSSELKYGDVIAELNTKIANKKIARLKIFNHGSLICDLDPSGLNVHASFDRFFSLSVLHPYLQIMLLDNEFSEIEITEVD